ncbi:MAG: TonB-dependent receptor, partial [Bacteroidales bacterium]|nr:TonB-dependent receptor [Bacteroidales bacterium]
MSKPINNKPTTLWGIVTLLGMLAVPGKKLLLCVLIALCSSTQANDGENVHTHYFDIPRQEITRALKHFAQQSNQPVLFPHDKVKGKMSNPLLGYYSVQEGIHKLVEGTGLIPVFSSDGVLTIKAQIQLLDKDQDKETSKGNTMKKPLPLLTALFSAILGSQENAIADTDRPQPARGLEEIVVTAQKRAENLQDVPIAVSAFSADDLRNFGAADTQSLQNTTPGLVYINSGAIAQPYLRGVGSRLLANGLESSIATYSDNRYVSRPSAAIFELADVERIEVLKGPQGTLYGRNATGGAIRIVTKGVADELEANLTASAGNYGYRGLSGTMSGPLNETLGARFTMLAKQRDGYADNLYTSGIAELDDQHFRAYRGKLRWEPNDRVDAELSLGYWEKNDTRGNDQVNLSPPGLNVGEFLGGIFGRDRKDAATAIAVTDKGDEFSSHLQLSISFDHFDFVSISTYSDMQMRLTTDGEGTSALGLDAYVRDEEKAYAQEFQLLSNGDGAWRWVAGAYLYGSDADFELLADLGSPSLLSQGDQNVETRAVAAFGQATWQFSTNWALTVGGRWSSEEKELVSRASRATPVTAVPTPYRTKADWDEFTPKVSLEYSLDNTLVYLTYARGFKSGGFNYPAIATPALDPEILDMLELGSKGTYLNGQLRLNTSLYFYDYRDLQVTRASSGTGLVTTENAANAEVLGLDLDLTWLATDNLTLTGGLNLLDSEYTDYPANAKVFNAALTGNPAAPGMSDVFYDAKGESLLRAPDWSAFLSMEYIFNLNRASMPLVLTYSYKDAYNFDFVAHP